MLGGPGGVLGYTLLLLPCLVALVGWSVMTASAASACAVTSVVRSAAVLMTFAGVVVVVVRLLGLLPKRLQYIAP